MVQEELQDRKQVFLGIDQSKRSTGCVWVDDTGEVIHFTLLAPHKDLDDVGIINEQWQELNYNLNYTAACDFAVIEGLSFAAVGSGKDFLAGLQWHFRANMELQHSVFLGPVPVTSWRSKVLSKEEQREAKADGKDGLKWAVFNKLPAQIRKNFSDYVYLHRERINAAKGLGPKSVKYVDASWDLADAYWLAEYRRKLSTCK